jgi:hypothetical protein
VRKAQTEEDFALDYTEDLPSGMSDTPNQLAELANSVVTKVLDNPRIVTSSINGLTQQLVSTNHEFSNLVDKFTDFLKEYKVEGENTRGRETGP